MITHTMAFVTPVVEHWMEQNFKNADITSLTLKTNKLMKAENGGYGKKSTEYY